MAYNKNRKVFRNVNAFNLEKERVNKELKSLNDDIEAKKSAKVFKAFHRDEKKNQYIPYITKFLKETDGYTHDSIEFFSYTYFANNTEEGKLMKGNIDPDKWNEAVSIMKKTRERTIAPFVKQQETNKMNYFLASVFDDDSVRLNKNVETIIFKDRSKRENQLNLNPGVEFSRKYGDTFIDLISTKDTNRTDVEDVKNVLSLSTANLNATNQSISSIEKANKKLQQTGNLVVFDLESFGGYDTDTGINKYDRITEFSFIKHTKNANGVREMSEEVGLMGFDEKTAREYLDFIKNEMAKGELKPNSLPGVTASRLAMYGDAEIEIVDGIAKVKYFPGDDFDEVSKINMEQIEKGAQKLVDAYNKTETVSFTHNGQTRQIKKDVQMLIDNAKELQDIFKNENGVVAGYNHIKYDIPFLNKQLRSYYNSDDQAIKDYIDKVFGVSNGNSMFLNPSGHGTNLDMRSVVEQASRAFGVDVIYGFNQDMINEVGVTPNRQEYVGAMYQRSMFFNPDGTPKSEAHKAEFDTKVLMSLIEDEMDIDDATRKRLNIPDTYKGSLLDYMLNHLSEDGFYDRKAPVKKGKKGKKNKAPKKVGLSELGTEFRLKESNRNDVYFMLSEKDRASGALGRGTGHLDFTYNSETGDFHFANRARKSSFDGKIESNEFYKPMNKDLIYQISGMKKVKTNEIKGLSEDLLETFDEYANDELYMVEFSAVTNDKHSDLAKTKHVKVFKSVDEMEGYLSSEMNMIAKKNSKGEIIFKDNKTRENLNVYYNGNFANDKNTTNKDVLERYVRHTDKSVSNDNARRFLFDQDKSFERVDGMLNFIKEKESSALIKDKSIKDLKKITADIATKQRNGAALNDVEKEVYDSLVKNLGYKFNGQNLIRPETIKNALNSIEFVMQNRDLLESVAAEVNSITKNKKGQYVSGHGRESASRIFRDSLSEIADDHVGEGRNNKLTSKQMRNTYDVKVNGIYRRRNTKVASNGINEFSDVITVTNLDSSKNAAYNLLDSLMKSYFGTDAKKMSGQSLYNAQKIVIEKFVQDAEFNSVELKKINNMLKQDDFNPYVAAESIVRTMRKEKNRDVTAGVIKLKTNEAFSNLNKNHVDKKGLADTLSKDPDYIKNVVQKHSKIKIYDPKKVSFKEQGKSRLDTLVTFSEKDIEDAVKRSYGNIADGSLGGKEAMAKKILYKNAKEELSNVIADLFASAAEAGAEIRYDEKNGRYSLVQGDNVVDVLLPKLKMTDNGMMYIKYGEQNIKLRHKVIINKAGEVSLGTSINDMYRTSNRDGTVVYKNKERVKAAMEEGTFELGQIADYFKRNFHSLSEDAKMTNIKAGDYYSNMTIDAKDFITKGIYALFGDVEDDELPEFSKTIRDRIKSKGLYDKEFETRFKELFGKSLSEDSVPPDALLYMARESPLMLRELLREISQDSGDVNEIANLIGIQSKKQETESGIYSLGEQRSVVTFTDAWNNMSRPVSGGSGNFYFTKLNTETSRVKNASSPEIKKGALISNKHYDSINTLIENDEEYISSARVSTLYTGDEGLDVIIKYQYEKAIEENTKGMVKGSPEYEKVANEITDQYAKMRANISVFEQQKIMDPLAFEKIYGNDVAADTKYFSTNLDLISALFDNPKNVSNKEYEMRSRLVDLIPEINIDQNTNQITFKSGEGKFVTRNDKVFAHKGFGDVKQYMNSKLKAGMFNLEVLSPEGIRLSDDKISKILSSHMDEFLENEKFGKETKEAIALKILEREGYRAKFAVKSINKQTLPKLNAGSGEKSMTTLLYTKTGSVDKDIRNVFEAIEQSFNDDSLKIVDNTVLREEAVRGILERYEKEGNNLLYLLNANNFSGGDVDEKIESLLDRLAEEQMSFRNILFGFGKLKDISAMSNDAIAKHGNIGMMLENNLANAVTVLSKYMDPNNGDKYEQALDFVINKMNEQDKNGNYKYGIFKNEEIVGIDGSEKIKKNITHVKATKGKHNNINFEDVVFTDDRHTIIDGDAFENLIRVIDEEIVKKAGSNLDEDDRLVAKTYYRPDPKTGKLELVQEDFLGQGLFVETKDGKRVLTGVKVEDVITRIDDPETETDADYRRIESMRKITEKESEQFELNREILNLKRDIRKYEKQSNWQNAAASKSELAKKERILKSNNREINQLREEAGMYQIKQMKYTSTDERLLRSHTFDEALINRINTANRVYGKDMVEEFKAGGLDFSKIMKVGDSGEYVLDLDDTISREVYEPFINRMRGMKTRKEGETLLTESMLKQKKYSHLSEIYERVKRSNLELGVESAQEIYDLSMAFESLNYNGITGLTSKFTLKDFEDKGFNRVDINDLPIMDINTTSKGIPNVIDTPTILDLGSRFDESERYITLPGFGQFIGDDQDAVAVKTEYHKKLGSLKRASRNYAQYANDAASTIEGVTEEEARQRVLDLANELKISMGNTFLSKEGIITKFGKRDAPIVSARQKITGTMAIMPGGDSKISEIFNDGDNIGRLEKAMGDADKSAIARAKINGKSLVEWEKMGVYHDYAFVSEDVFRTMGIFDKKNLKAMGLTEEGMRKKLQEEGMSTLAIRYPEIYDSSLINTKLFLDTTVGGNSIRFAAHTMRKFNGDVDGDSASFMMLESKNRMNSLIYSNFKKKFKGLDQGTIEKELENAGYSYEDDYKLFEQAEMKAGVDAFTENRAWHKDVRGKLNKDVEKNTTSTISNFSGNTFKAKVSNLVDNGKLKNIDNTVDNMLNDAMEIINGLDSSIVNSDSFKEKYGAIAELTEEVRLNTAGGVNAKNGFKVSVTEMNNPTKLMNAALDVIKDYGDLNAESTHSKGHTLGELVDEQGGYSLATDVRKMYNDAFIEQSNKTGAAAIGSVNVKLVPLKDASRAVFSDGTDLSYKKDVAIQEIAAMIEQNAINFKKKEATGNQSAVPEINKALTKAIKGDSVEGEKLLRSWFDDVIGEDAFESVYDKIYESSNKLDQSQMERQIVERSIKNNTSEAVEKSRYASETFIKAVTELSGNPRTESYFARAVGTTSSNRTNSFRVVKMMNEGETGDIHNIIAGTNVYEGLEDAKKAQKLAAEAEQRGQNFMREVSVNKSQAVDAIAQVGSKVKKGLLGHKSSGLALGVIGLASGLMISGFASGNPLQQDESPYLSSPTGNSNPPQSIPEFFDQQGGFVQQQSNNGGYIINVRADTKKGKKELERTMKKVAKQGFGGVSVNMSVRDKNKPKSNQDIQNWIESNL